MKPLYTPPDGAASAMARYLAAHDFATYDDAWRWSVDDLEGFWASIWDWFDVRAHRPYDRVLASRAMPGAKWFPAAELNYVDQARRWPADSLAIISEQCPFGGAAVQHPVICAVDRGIVRGMLETLYGDTAPETSASRPHGDDICITLV